METGFTMFVHASIVTAVLYIVMKFLLKQSESKAQDRSFLIGAVVLIYMILFGHKLPGHINSNIF